MARYVVSCGVLAVPIFFRMRLRRIAATKSEIGEVLGDGQLLGNHSGRMKLA